MTAALEDSDINRELTARQAGVRRELGAMRVRLRWRLFVRGLAHLTGSAVLLAAASLLFDRWLRFGWPLRLVLLIVGLSVLAAVFIRRVARPLQLRLGDLDLAYLLDRRLPGVGQRVANVLQLPELLTDRSHASSAMVRAAVRADGEALRSAEWPAVVDARGHRRGLALLGTVAAVVVVAIMAMPETMSLWSRRLFLLSDERWPQSHWLVVVGARDGVLLAPRGEPLVLQVASDPAFDFQDDRWRVVGRNDVVLPRGGERPRPVPPDRVTLRWQDAEATTHRGIFEHLSANRFRYELPPSVTPLRLAITGGEDWMDSVEVRPVDRPAVEQIVIEAAPPGTHGERRAYEVGATQLQFLPHTELTLRLRSTVGLDSARLVSRTESIAPMLQAVGEREYTASWTMSEPLTLELQLIGGEGHLPAKPTFVSIGVLADRPPRVTLRTSGVGRRITPQARVPVTARALDDFGLTALCIEIECARPGGEEGGMDLVTQPIEVSGAARQTDVEDHREVAVAPFAVTPGTLLRLRAAALDNCVEGPQSSPSRWVTLQVVSVDELFFEILLRQRAERTRFAAATESARDVLASLEASSAEGAADGLLRKHQVISRQVGQVAGRLTAILREMELNDLGSASTRELMDSEIVQPLGQLQSSKLADMRPLLENLVGTPRLDTLPNPASLDAATVAAELDNRQAAHDKQREVVTEMEVILARMQQWESFVDVLNQLRQVIKLQSGVLDDVERQRKSLTDDLFDDEIDDEIDDDAAEGGEADDEGHTAGSSDDAS